VLLDAEDQRFGGDGPVIDVQPQPGARVALPGFWFAVFRRDA
jgi:hypothetical protein